MVNSASMHRITVNNLLSDEKEISPEGILLTMLDKREALSTISPSSLELTGILLMIPKSRLYPVKVNCWLTHRIKIPSKAIKVDFEATARETLLMTSQSAALSQENFIVKNRPYK